MYNVQWLNCFGTWVLFSEHVFLWRARARAGKQLVKTESVRRWRILNGDRLVIYSYEKKVHIGKCPECAGWGAPTGCTYCDLRCMGG